MKKKMKKIMAAGLAGVLLVGGIPLTNAAFAKTKLKVSSNQITVQEGKKKSVTTNMKAKFTSSNKKIATVTNGKTKKCVIKGKNPGKCSVVVKVKKYTAKIKVTVKKAQTNETTASPVATAQTVQTVTTAPAGTIIPTQPVAPTKQATVNPTVVPTSTVESTANVTSTPSETHIVTLQPTTNVSASPKVSAQPEETKEAGSPVPTNSQASTTEPEMSTAPELTTGPAVSTAPAVTTTPGVSASPVVASPSAIPTEEPVEENSIYHSVNQLGLKLFNLCEEQEGGKVLSPYSISTAMTVLTNAAGDNTKTELEDVLGITDWEPWNEAYSTYFLAHSDNDYDPEDEGDQGDDEDDGYHYKELNLHDTTVVSKNSFWCNEENYSFDSEEQEAYFEKMQDMFTMEKKVMDFENGNPKDQINAWVSESTKGKIQKLLLEDLQKNASSVLVNTVYFNGDWLDTFDIDCTTEEDFYGDNETTKVEMMRGEKEYYQYYEDEEFQMVSLPFYDREYCFNILMSKDKEVSTPRLFAGKSEREQEKLFEELLSSEDRKVVVHLPKFEFEYGTLSLKEMLQALGMEDAFSGKDAYFPEIQGENAENFFVEDVLHKTKIEVKERGVTAAAATAIIKEAGALPGEPTPEPYIYFNVDHSFVYTITDSDGMIYFVGQVSDLVK